MKSIKFRKITRKRQKKKYNGSSQKTKSVKMKNSKKKLIEKGMPNTSKNL